MTDGWIQTDYLDILLRLGHQLVVFLALLRQLLLQFATLLLFAAQVSTGASAGSVLGLPAYRIHILAVHYFGQFVDGLHLEQLLLFQLLAHALHLKKN